MDLAGAMYVLGVGGIPMWTVEAVAAVFGILTFCGAYFLLYRKDRDRQGE